MVYGDGAFKDPVGKILGACGIRLCSPAYTEGLAGTPNEVKLKYLADNNFSHLSGEDLKKAIQDYIHEKDEKAKSLVGSMETQGTTPRRLTDLYRFSCRPDIRKRGTREHRLFISRDILIIIQNKGLSLAG